MTDLETQLSVATGTGLLLRQANVVLFIPQLGEGVEALLEAIRRHPGAVDATFDHLADLVVEREFAVPDFACVGLTDRIKIRAFGEIEVTTDLASAPMLSGAGSTTWVEHGAAMPANGSVSVSAGTGAGAEPSEGAVATDLVEGVVPAGGFRLIARQSVPTQSSDSDAPAPTESSNAAAQSTAGQDARVVAALDALGSEPSGDPEDPPVEAAMESSLASDVFDADLIDATDVPAAESSSPASGAKPEAGLSADNTIMPPADLLETPPPPPSAEVGDSAVPPAPVAGNPPPAPATSQSSQPSQPSVAPAGASTSGKSVMARPCPSGHSNRPSRATCSVCEAFLPSGQDALELMSRPPVGHLVFTDGSRHVLDKNLVIGRAPVVDDEAECEIKVIRSDQISRRHLEISVKGWDVFVEDCGSRNGTVLIPIDGAVPVKVEPGMPQLIEPGAAIHFADQTIILAAVGHSPIAMNGNEVADG